MYENEAPTEAEAVQDVIDAETTLERLVPAFEAYRKQCENAKIVHSEVAAECARRGEKMKRYADRMRDLALELARVGSYDHKGKNEAILSAVASLLSFANGMVEKPAAQDMDDIPF